MGDQIKVPKIVHAKDSIVLLNHQNIIIKDMKFTTKSSHVPLASGAICLSSGEQIIVSHVNRFIFNISNRRRRAGAKQIMR